MPSFKSINLCSIKLEEIRSSVSACFHIEIRVMKTLLGLNISPSAPTLCGSSLEDLFYIKT